MRVWTYCGQSDLTIDIVLFTEDSEEKAQKYARAQKAFLGKRLVYTLDLLEVRGS